MKNFRKMIYLFIVSIITVDFMDSGNSSHSIIFAMEEDAEAGEELLAALKKSEKTEEALSEADKASIAKPSVGKPLSKVGSSSSTSGFKKMLSDNKKTLIIGGLGLAIPTAAVGALVATK